MMAQQIAWPESRLGIGLLNWTTRHQSVTELGSSFYDRWKRVRADVEWADGIADDATDPPRGRLRVRAPVSFGTDSLTPALARYLQTYPEIEIELVSSGRFVDLIDDAFEAVLRTGPRADHGLASVERAPFGLVACAAHDCLAHAHWSGGGDYPWRFAKGDRIEEVPVRGRLGASDAKALATVAIAGFGIALLAENSVHLALRVGRRMRILPDHAPPPRSMHLLFRPDRRQTPKLRSVIDTVVAAFPTRGAAAVSTPLMPAKV